MWLYHFHISYIKYVSNLSCLWNLAATYAGRHATLCYKIRALTRGNIMSNPDHVHGTFPKYIHMTVHPLQNYSRILWFKSIVRNILAKERMVPPKEHSPGKGSVLTKKCRPSTSSATGRYTCNKTSLRLTKPNNNTAYKSHCVPVFAQMLPLNKINNPMGWQSCPW